MPPGKSAARLAGLFFLLAAAAGLFMAFIFSRRLFDLSGLSAAVRGELYAGFLYRAGITANIIMSLFFALAALALYKLFAPVSKNLAALMVMAAAAACVLQLAFSIAQITPLLSLNGSGPSAAPPASRFVGMTVFADQAYPLAYAAARILYALWLLMAGILAHRSLFIPKALGVLLFIKGILLLTAVPAHFILPGADVERVLSLPGIIILFIFWLLIRGVRESAPPKLATAVQPPNVKTPPLSV